MASGDGFIYIIVGFFAGLFFFVKGLGWFKQMRLISDMPTSKVRSIAMGLVEVYGKIVASEGRVLKSPFTAKDCVYYKYKIEEYRSNGKSSSWVTVRKGEMAELFYLKDETGMVLVDPKGANVDIPSDNVINSGIGNSPSQTVLSFLGSQRLSHKSLFFNKRMRYTEYFLAPGDNCYILGTAGDNPFVEDATVQEGMEDVMIRKGQGGIFYITDKQEKDLLSSLKRKAMLGVIGGPLLSGACLALIFISMGTI